MYLNYKDKKIQLQKKIIAQLHEENQFLKEQLVQCDSNAVKAKTALAEKAQKEYQELTMELNNLKTEYQKLIRDTRKNCNQWIHASKAVK